MATCEREHVFAIRSSLEVDDPVPKFVQTEARHEDGDEDETSEGRTRAAAAARNKKLVKLAFFALALLACNSGSHAALAVAESSIAASSLGVKVASFLRGSGWPDELVVLTVAMLPVLELRGAIPISYWLRVDPIKGYFIAVLGSVSLAPLQRTFSSQIDSHLAKSVARLLIPPQFFPM